MSNARFETAVFECDQALHTITLKMMSAKNTLVYLARREHQGFPWDIQVKIRALHR
jgi:hypothetical protein